MKRMLFFSLSLSLLLPMFASSASAAIAVVAPDGSTQFRFGGRFEPIISCRPLTICDVELEDGETVNSIAIGDSTRWIVATTQSGTTPHILLKATSLDLSTNMVVTTSKRAYHLRLRSDRTLHNSRISFSYPDEEAAARREAAAVQVLEQQRQDSFIPLLPPDKLDTHYRISGANQIKPKRVFNDGVHTFIQFDHLPVDLPTVYANPKNSGPQIVNFRVHENMFIVDGTQDAFSLILNAGTGRHGRGQLTVEISHE